MNSFTQEHPHQNQYRFSNNGYNNLQQTISPQQFSIDEYPSDTSVYNNTSMIQNSQPFPFFAPIPPAFGNLDQFSDTSTNNGELLPQNINNNLPFNLQIADNYQMINLNAPLYNNINNVNNNDQFYNHASGSIPYLPNSNDFEMNLSTFNSTESLPHDFTQRVPIRRNTYPTPTDDRSALNSAGVPISADSVSISSAHSSYTPPQQAVYSPISSPSSSTSSSDERPTFKLKTGEEYEQLSTAAKELFNRFEPIRPALRRTIQSSPTLRSHHRSLKQSVRKKAYSTGNLQFRNGLHTSQPGPIPASKPEILKDPVTGEETMRFSYSKQKIIKVFTLKCPADSINIDDLPKDFKIENCVYPRAMVPKEQYKGNRGKYERDCNEVGWMLAWHNPEIRNHRGIIQRAVDSWRNTRSDKSLRSRRVRKSEGNL